MRTINRRCHLFSFFFLFSSKTLYLHQHHSEIRCEQPIKGAISSFSFHPKPKSSNPGSSLPISSSSSSHSNLNQIRKFVKTRRDKRIQLDSWRILDVSKYVLFRYAYLSVSNLYRIRILYRYGIRDQNGVSILHRSLHF